LKKRTRVTHLPEVRLPPDNRPLVAPIYQSVKFSFDDVAETLRYFGAQREGFYYSRVSNPTLRQLELALADLQGRDDCVLTGSGVAAIALSLLALLKAGDHVVYFAELYPPTRALVRKLLGRYGVSSTMLSLDDTDSLERVLAATPTRLVALESPSNPVLKVADLERITALARAHGALTLLDNTLAGLHNHGEFDVDLYVHSLTKFASGHGDVMGGAVIGRGELVEQLREDCSHLGPTLDPHAAWLVLRGLKTYYLRWDAQCANALRVAEFLATRPGGEPGPLPGAARRPGPRARRKANGRLRRHRQLRPRRRTRGRHALRRGAGALQPRGKPGIHRVAGGCAGHAATAGLHRRAARVVRHRSRHGAPLDRHRGHR
jgi:cystathionine beta-lyase/cystathionine gamma-synthase